jgi:hypothetical protein
MSEISDLAKKDCSKALDAIIEAVMGSKIQRRRTSYRIWYFLFIKEKSIRGH